MASGCLMHKNKSRKRVPLPRGHFIMWGARDTVASRFKWLIFL